jgi:hypothetical protein
MKCKRQMKKIKHILTILFCMAGLIGLAQTGKTKEEIETYKVAFITKNVGLSSAEAQTFWPLYNDYQQKKEDLRQAQLKENKKANADFSNLSDADIEKLIDNQVMNEQKEVDLLKDFHKKVKQVLPAKKIAKLYKAEEDFKRELIKALKEKS